LQEFGRVLEEQGTPVEGVRALFVMNHENGGFDRPGYAWPDDPSGLHLDICENGVKHVTWELTRKQAGRDFFAAHTVSELAGWTDYDLEAAGRLAEPVHYDPDTDPVRAGLVGGCVRPSWPRAARSAQPAPGRVLHLRAAQQRGDVPVPAVSARVRHQQPARPNMCHEASGRDLTAAIGTGKGTVDLADWDKADAIWLMDDDAATNAPRMLTWLAEADRRGAELVHINPLIEAASRHTIAPHEFADIATFRSTKIGTRNVQVRIGVT